MLMIDWNTENLFLLLHKESHLIQDDSILVYITVVMTK